MEQNGDDNGYSEQGAESSIGAAQLRHLYQALIGSYPAMVSLDLRKEQYQFLHYPKEGLRGVPTEGAISLLCDWLEALLHPLHRKEFRKHFSREGLRKKLREGQYAFAMQLWCLCMDGRYHWIELRMLAATEQAQEQVFLLARLIDEEKQEFVLNEIMSSAFHLSQRNFYDTVYFIFPQEDACERYHFGTTGRFGDASYGSYERERQLLIEQIAERERGTFFRNTALDFVKENIREQGGAFSVRYCFINGATPRYKELRYSFYHGEESRLLLTIRDVHEAYMQMRKNAMLNMTYAKVFQGNYDKVCRLDLTDKTYMEMRLTGDGTVKEYPCETERLRYFEDAELQFVHPDDRELYRQECAPEVLQAKVERGMKPF